MMSLIKTIATRWLSVIGLVASVYVLSTAYNQHKQSVQCAAQTTLANAQKVTDQAHITQEVTAQAAQRSIVLSERGHEIVKRAPTYVPKDTFNLPGSWRVYHDAAAKSELSETAGATDAAPVDAQDAAATVAQNYAACHLNAQRLSDLQEWVTRQHKVGQ